MLDHELISILRCPDCRVDKLSLSGAELICEKCTARFPVAGHRPVLLRHDNTIFPVANYCTLHAPEPKKQPGLERFIPSPSVNLASARVLGRLREFLDKLGRGRVLVIGAGTQRTWLDPLIRASQPHRLIYSDIDRESDADLFCDVHELPFVDGAFDAVVTTAVLEHVLYPESAASEIVRVLKSGGLLYSEMPFMQQVHEGAYDFTRYTLSGHRRLFNRLAEIEVGMVAGPGTALVWALENLLLAFITGSSQRKLAKAASRLVFSWIKHVDRFLAHRPQAMDGASCTYFLGSKTGVMRSDADIIASYIGAKHLTH